MRHVVLRCALTTIDVHDRVVCADVDVTLDEEFFAHPRVVVYGAYLQRQVSCDVGVDQCADALFVVDLRDVVRRGFRDGLSVFFREAHDFLSFLVGSAFLRTWERQLW